MLLDSRHWSSDSELESELDEDVLVVLPWLGVRLKPPFAGSLFAVVFFVEDPSFANSVGIFSEEFLASEVTLLSPSLVDS